MAARRSSLMLLVALTGWAVFGSWALWSDAVLGHSVAFFFFSICFLGLIVQLFGARRGLAPSIVLLVGIAGASEYLQPRFTSRPAEWADVASDLVGVGLAAVVVTLAALAVRRRNRLWPVMGVLCLAALAGSLWFAAVGNGRIEDRFEDRVGCWGRGLDPSVSVAGEPIIHVAGQSIAMGDKEAVPLGDGLVAADSVDLRCAVLRSGSYAIVATVVPATTEVGGPMRIFTSSVSTRFNEENTHLGQDFDELSVRVNSDGVLQWESVPDVFVAGERVTVAMVVGDGQVNVFVDGERRASFDLVGESFTEWDGEFPILIGDEFTRDRTFEGVIESVSVFDRILVEGDSALAARGS